MVTADSLESKVNQNLFVTGANATLSMCIFRDLSQEKYTWEQATEQLLI